MADVSTAISSISKIHRYDMSYPQESQHLVRVGSMVFAHVSTYTDANVFCKMQHDLYCWKALLQGAWFKDTALRHQTGGTEGRWVIRMRMQFAG